MYSYVDMIDVIDMNMYMIECVHRNTLVYEGAFLFLLRS